jgi:hypothetical protein
MSSASSSASSNLSRDVIARLNEQFYRHSPHHYFERRLAAALAVPGPEEREHPLPQGFHAAAVEAALGGEADFDPASFEADTRELYLAAEATVLLHHAGEALLRLYLAHQGDPPCPWIELAGMKDFRRFKQLVRERLLDVPADRLRSEVETLFLGGPRPEDDADRGRCDEMVKNCAEFLRVFAHQFLDEGDAAIYNAAKHGLAINAGRHQLAFVPADDARNDPEQERAVAHLIDSLSFNGVTLEALAWVGTSKRGEWHRKQKWVDPARDLAYAYAAVRLMANLWSVARARYEDGGEVAIYLVDRLSARTIARLAEGRVGAISMPILARPLPDHEAKAVLDRLAMEREQ